MTETQHEVTTTSFGDLDEKILGFGGRTLYIGIDDEKQPIAATHRTGILDALNAWRAATPAQRFDVVNLGGDIAQANGYFLANDGQIKLLKKAIEVVDSSVIYVALHNWLEGK